MRLLVSTLALALSAAMLSAQSFTTVHEQKNLSPTALAKLQTLDSLNTLPEAPWRVHLGDLPHGESPSLDDSAWPIAHPHDKFPADAVWFRRVVTVPPTLHGYDITGTRITFQFNAGASDTMQQIVYFDGRRVALGEDLEPIVLFEPARPGQKILVAVKLLRTTGEKTFDGADLRLEPTAATALRPSPQDIRIQALTAATLLTALPTPRPDLLPKVEQAIAAIDMHALTAANQPVFDRSLRKAQDILATLQPTLAPIQIDLAGNSHIDAAWLWPRSETIDVVRRTFTTALQLMNEYPDYTFTQSAAQYSEWIAEKYPALNAQIKQRIQEGRWEIVGGMWVEPDLNLPGGESLVRQLLVGQRFFRQQYGVAARIGWNPDSFGYNWQLPQIYKRSGLDYFVTQKMHWNDTNILPFRLFWWQSPDGSKVLTYFPTDYVHDNVNPTRIAGDFAETAERNPGTTELLDLYGIGDHGGGPTRAMLDQADHWIAAAKSGKDAVPTMRYHTAQSYFTSVEGHLSPESKVWDYDSIAKGYTAPIASAPGTIALPTWNSELYFEYHRGVQTTQAAHKRNMRTSETATLDAEKLASLAWLSGRPYPAADLTESWKKITFNQFHDLAAGSGIAVIYKDAQRDFTEVFHSDAEIAHNSLETLAAGIDTHVKGDIPILVLNPSPWPRTETVQMEVQLPDAAEAIRLLDSQNKPVPTQTLSQDPTTHQFRLLARAADVPALGYTVLHAEKGEHKIATDLKLEELPTAFVLSNSKLKLSIDRQTGCITTLEAAATEYLSPGACGNQLQTFKDTPKDYDAWNIDPGTLDAPMTPITAVDAIVVRANGPLRKTVHITRSWGQSTFTQDISLDSESDHVDIANDIDWHETHILLKAAFPLAATSAKATYEIPFGAIERTTLRTNSWEKAQFEVPALRWADLGDEKQGVSLLNDSKYGYDAAGNTLRLTLLRAPISPDPDADRGRQRFTYSIYPHTGSWKRAQTVHRGYELNDPLTAHQVLPHTGTLPAEYSWAGIENPNVILTAIKKAEDANALIVRMYESTGTATEVKLHLPPGATAATETNLMEKPEGPTLPIHENILTIPIKAWQILTLQIAYPPPA